MYDENDFLPISALQHLAFCVRQCALIHLENQWAENQLTADGRILHARVHDQFTESRPGVKIARSLRLHSFRLGLIGQADVVEFHQVEGPDTAGVKLENGRGLWRVFPVEYKRGRPKNDNCDSIQLCAQAICLEEMLHTAIMKGALYYGKLRQRTVINFDESLRNETENTALKLHELIKIGRTPPARYGKKCKKCSLYHPCMPKVTGVHKNIDRYLAGAGFDDEEDW